MLKVVLGLTFVILFSPRLGFAAPAVLIEEGHAPQNLQPSGTGGWKDRSQPISEGKSILKMYDEQVFDSAYDLRSQRRVGVGASAFGLSGVYGALVELNFAPEDSVLTGFGGGPKFSSFSFTWRHLFEGQSIAPYVGLGYSRWFSHKSGSGSVGNTTPSFLGSRFLSDEEKRTGLFEKNIIAPSVGLQYFQLDGPAKGLGIFVEIDLLAEVSDPSPIPTAGLGTLYYF